MHCFDEREFIVIEITKVRHRGIADDRFQQKLEHLTRKWWFYLILLLFPCEYEERRTLTPPMWWMGVLHFPLLIISMTSLSCLLEDLNRNLGTNHLPISHSQERQLSLALFFRQLSQYVGIPNDFPDGAYKTL